MGVKICWRAAKSRRKKRGDWKREKEWEKSSLGNSLFLVFVLIYEWKKTRQREDEQDLWGNRVMKNSWSSKGRENKMKQWENGKKKRRKDWGHHRISVWKQERGYLIGCRQKGRRAEKKWGKQKMKLSYFTLLVSMILFCPCDRPVVCEIHWRRLVVREWSVLTSLFTFITSS